MIKVVIECDEVTGKVKIEMPDNQLVALGLLTKTLHLICAMEPSKILSPNGSRLPSTKPQ